MIWGCEVTTRQGHFLGLFMKRPVKFLTHVEAAIEAIKEQGGLCSSRIRWAGWCPASAAARSRSC